ncbi:hypothetical protein AUC61_23295 [Pseudomonas sp. S25]|uniref:Lipoprotein n=1 Tax=Pseudomonas maioricensis TaxID=1766623 RepID=A0ABS9ZPE9_9PSED|nr:hypothetical protein [Pseudomonas sp. S25]MCI8212460.1 hypothetical protein [Pseudomonas sp. S25]
MNRIYAFALLLTVAVVSGCSTHHAVELRPYTAEETHQLALEDLNRRGLSFDEYQVAKAKLLAEPQMQAVRDFDNRGEISAENVQASQDRQG